ncbi:MAG: glutamate--tRNA ligase, partial [Nanoarchaeota archaeon]|nr:glutamate--tRNA ligase [Nanoarchaeota archaeon]
LEKYYEYFEKFIDMGKAYVCTCDPEAYKKLIGQGKACDCRELEISEQKDRWKKMFKEYKQGEAVGRLKTDLKDKNPAMRDFPLVRINEANHARQKKKYRVWPLMNLAVTVDDIESGMTHVIRAKDHVDNAKRQEIMYKYLGKKFPEALFVGKINFEGMPLSSTKTGEGIKEGKYSGWDDIRLPFLPALRRRGFTPEALTKYALEVGLSLVDKTVSKDEFFKAIEHFNKEVIDSEADRFFFVANPKKLKVSGANDASVEIEKYPGKPERGFRKFKTNGEFYVSGLDEVKKGNNYRLMHLFNFKDGKFVSDEVDDSLKARALHWLPLNGKNVKVKVLIPDGKWVAGLAEEGVSKLKVGQIVQFERFGFVRLDKKGKDELEFWFAHK